MSRRERKYAVGGTVQTYDFFWDGDDRLHQVKQGVSSRFSATYNGDGLRASKTDLFSATYHFTWGPGGVLYDGATTYTPGLAQRYGTTEPRYSHSDWVGSTRYLSESTGLLMPSALRYDAFGQRTALAGPNYPTPYQFAGGWGYEAEYSDASEPYLGLEYVDQRYYEPATGRFISPDPIGFDGGLNLFAYCDNDPVNSVDPSGLIHSLGGSREVPEGGGGGVSEEDELLFVFLIGLLEGMKDPAGMHAPLVPRLGRPGGGRVTPMEPEVGPGVPRGLTGLRPLRALPEAIPPRGFASYGEFQNACGSFRSAAGAGDAVIGVRGNAATGVSFRGGGFRPDSDIDFFIASDRLYGQALARGARPHGRDFGTVGVAETGRFPQLRAVEGALRRQLGRKVSIRIMSRAGYERLRSPSDVLAR